MEGLSRLDARVVEAVSILLERLLEMPYSQRDCISEMTIGELIGILSDRLGYEGSSSTLTPEQDLGVEDHITLYEWARRRDMV